MRAIIQIFLAIIISIIIGFRGSTFISIEVKKRAIEKVSKAIGSLQEYTEKLTN